MQKEIINVGNLKGTHGGWKVYYGGGIIATLGASDFKHSKMILLCVNKNDNEDYYGVHIRQKKKRLRQED